MTDFAAVTAVITFNGARNAIILRYIVNTDMEIMKINLASNFFLSHKTVTDLIVNKCFQQN